MHLTRCVPLEVLVFVVGGKREARDEEERHLERVVVGTMR